MYHPLKLIIQQVYLRIPYWSALVQIITGDPRLKRKKKRQKNKKNVFQRFNRIFGISDSVISVCV